MIRDVNTHRLEVDKYHITELALEDLGHEDWFDEALNRALAEVHVRWALLGYLSFKLSQFNEVD